MGIKVFTEPELLSNEERMRELELSSLERSRLGGALSMCINTLWVAVKKEGAGLFSAVFRTQGNGPKVVNEVKGPN